MQRCSPPVKPFVRFIHRVTNLIGHSQLIVTLGFGAWVARGALHDGSRRNFTETSAKDVT
jgi:hypothetical protein